MAVGFSGGVAARLIQPGAPMVQFVDEQGAVEDLSTRTFADQQALAVPAEPAQEAAPVSAPRKAAPAVTTALLAASGPDRELERTRVVLMEVTAYCPCEKCCGTHSPGITASGKHVSYNKGRFVAADTRVLPFGTKVSIPGYHEGVFVPVLDRGGAIKGNKLDLYFPTHQAALKWGRQKVAVTIALD